MFSSIQSTGGLQRICLICTILFGMTALAACGGGGSGGNSGNSAPTATITSPLDGAVYTYGDTITFTGSGTDTQNGEISGDSLVWTSDLDGSVGTGASFSVTDLSWGDHAITLTATDSDAATASDSIYVSVKAWTHPANLDDNISTDGYHAYNPRVAMNGSGDAVIAWLQIDDSGDVQIFKSVYQDGVWAHPTGITDNISPDGYDASEPQVAIGDNGDIVITWQQDDDNGDSQIFKSEYRNGGWTHPTGLTDNISPNGYDATEPQVAMDDSGNTVITWTQRDGTYMQIFKSEYRNGGWTHPTGLTDNISTNEYHAQNSQVTMDGYGNTVITWNQNDGSNEQIFKSEYRNGTWTLPTGITDNISPDGYDASTPQVAMDDNGNAIIIWYQFDGSYCQVFKSEYRNGAWTHPTGITDNISPDGQHVYTPQVAMDDNGNAIITWRQKEGSNVILLSEYRDGEWTHPGDLSNNITPDGSDDSRGPQVAMGGNGNAIITWYQYDGSTFQIFKSEYRNGIWTHPTGLTDNISPDEYMSSPDVAMDDSGNAIITWDGDAGSDDQIFMSEYY